jgi:hypothetical protein
VQKRGVSLRQNLPFILRDLLPIWLKLPLMRSAARRCVDEKPADAIYIFNIRPPSNPKLIE